MPISKPEEEAQAPLPKRRAFVKCPKNYFKLSDQDKAQFNLRATLDVQVQLGIKPSPKPGLGERENSRLTG